jgi:chaperone modulatory protein CbpM
MMSEIAKDDTRLTLHDVCERCEISVSTLTAYVEEGLIEVGGTRTEWRFSENHLVHIHKARRLERDLRLNPAGVVLVIDLLARIDGLTLQLKRFET